VKLKSITFKPSAALEFSEAEIDLMARCAAVHYDGHCKDTLKPGGVIATIKSMNETCPGRPHHLKWREIDTLAKVLEVGQYIRDGAVALSLNVALRQVLTQLNDTTPEPKTYE